MLKLERCNNDPCGKAYLVERCSPAFADGAEAGVIECPHCGFRRTPSDARLVYVCRRLSAELQAWVDAEPAE